MEDTALVSALGRSVKDLAKESLEQRKLLIKDHITKAFDSRVDARTVEVIAKLLSNPPTERPEATEVVQIFGELGYDDTCCCIPWSERGRAFIRGVSVIVSFLWIYSIMAERGQVYYAAIMSLSILPFWGWLVLGARGPQRAVRLVCFQVNGEPYMDTRGMWRPLEDSMTGLHFAFGWVFFGLFIGAAVNGDSLQDMGVGAAGCGLMWLNAIRLYVKRNRAEQQVAALRGPDPEQVVVV